MDSSENTALNSTPGLDPLNLPPGPRPSGLERIPWAYVLAFLLGTVLVLGWTWYHIESERRSILAHWQARISAVADDRERLVENWIEARRADAEVLAASPGVLAALGVPKRGDGDLPQHLDLIAAAYGYASISVFDSQGRVIARSQSAESSGAEADAVAVARTRQARIELIGDGDDRRLTIAVPAFPEGRAGGRERTRSTVLGVVMLRMQPEAGLYPLLTEAISAKTGEALIFRLGGSEPTYLSPLRHAGAGLAAVSRSLEALRSQSTNQHGHAFGWLTDYRAAPVLAATRRLDPMGWGLVLKVDREEALIELYRSGQLAGAAAAFLLVALGALLIGLWRQRQRAHLLRAQIEHERALFDLKGYADNIVASIPSGLLLLSADLRVLSANRAFLESFRLESSAVIDRELQEVMQAEGLIRRAREVLQTGVPQRDVVLDLHLEHHRETRPTLITLTRIRMAREEAARLLLIVQDLTEEERLHAARRVSEQRFRDLVQGLDAIVWEAEATTLRFSFVSQRAEIVLGYPAERWLRDRDFAAMRIHPDDRERVMTLSHDAIARGTDHELEYRAIAADGRELWLRDIVHVVKDDTGRATQLRGLTVDLTERKRAEEILRQTENQLRQAQKMDAVGKLAGGIAHDFNNLLMVIRGDSDLLLRRLPAGHPLRQHAEGVRDAADQAATLTRQLLAFSRKQVLAPTVLDIDAVVDGMQAFLQRLLGETITLVTLPARDLGRITADQGQIEQMILNLAVNARDAMPEGGRVTIRTANEDLDVAAAQRRGNVKPGRYVTLEVNDTGIGMDAETKAHLFEPFFTTKDQGKGTGLGLSTVYGIVNQSGGHIWLESEPGRGTTFRVFLPRVEDTAPLAAEPTAPLTSVGPERADTVSARRTPAPAPAQRDRRPGGETILLVEDAHRVRAVVREILEMSGYNVLEARNGAQALQISGAHEGPIQLMVTDVVMPQMSGRELAQQLARLRPDMKVLYMSGYTDDAIVRHGVLGAGMAFVSKPFTPDALATKVRELLDAAPRLGPEAARTGPHG